MTPDRGSAPTRREFLATTTLAGAALAARAGAAATSPAPALIAITLDLEMARNFPRWEDSEWDYEKGNLDAQTKRYAVEAGASVKGHGARVHYFLVGRVLEQPDVDWLTHLLAEGHAIGNHTYDHVHLKALTARDTQFRFQRAPWLIEGRNVADVLRENIALCTAAMKTRLGIAPAGFRTPGGFPNGLRDRPDLQRMMRELGFSWISATYPAHPNSPPGEAPTAGLFTQINATQKEAQPFAYESGLIDVPMTPVSDVAAFRNGRWTLDQYLESIRAGVGWAIENRACYDFLAHPAVLAVKDPQFRAIDLICDLVKKAGDHARFAMLEEFAGRAR